MDFFHSVQNEVHLGESKPNVVVTPEGSRNVAQARAVSYPCFHVQFLFMLFVEHSDIELQCSNVWRKLLRGKSWVC